MAKRLQLKGERFNRLVVLDFAYMKKRKSHWKCLCDCGNVVIVWGCHLKNWHTKSCGCLRKESNIGRKATLQARKNMSKAQKGEKSYWYGRKHTDDSKKKMSEAQSGKNHWAYGKRGEDTARYNPNITDKERLERRDSSINKTWAKAVYKLDNYTCRKCGCVGKNLNAHHIESFKNNPELRIEVSNGITFCKKCHILFHHVYGEGSTRSQLIKFLRS